MSRVGDITTTFPKPTQDIAQVPNVTITPETPAPATPTSAIAKVPPIENPVGFYLAELKKLIPDAGQAGTLTVEVKETVNKHEIKATNSSIDFTTRTITITSTKPGSKPLVLATGSKDAAFALGLLGLSLDPKGTTINFPANADEPARVVYGVNKDSEPNGVAANSALAALARTKKTDAQDLLAIVKNDYPSATDIFAEYVR